MVFFIVWPTNPSLPGCNYLLVRPKKVSCNTEVSWIEKYRKVLQNTFNYAKINLLAGNEDTNTVTTKGHKLYQSPL